MTEMKCPDFKHHHLPNKREPNNTAPGAPSDLRYDSQEVSGSNPDSRSQLEDGDSPNKPYL